MHLPICPRIVLLYRPTIVFVLPSTQALVPLLCLRSRHAFHLLSPICPRDHAMFLGTITCIVQYMPTVHDGTKYKPCTLHLLPAFNSGSVALAVQVLHKYIFRYKHPAFVTRHEEGAEVCTAASALLSLWLLPLPIPATLESRL